MKNETTHSVISNPLFDFFKSVRLTVVVLLMLAATSVVGTLIPQNKHAADYIDTYGVFLYQVFHVLDIFDMYQSWWFRLLLVALTVNILVCTYSRLFSKGKIVFPRFRLSGFKNMTLYKEFLDKRSPEELGKVYQSFVSAKYDKSQMVEEETGFSVLAEKGRWTRLGVHIVHLSIVLLLAGALIGSLFGFDGYVNIPEGETVNSITLRDSKKKLPLGFEIRCDDFNVSYYKTGAAKEFRSSLVILEDGKSVMKKDIIVNDPLHYKGITLYQSSYGSLKTKDLVLSFTHRKSGKTVEQPVSVGQTISMPGGGRRLKVKSHSSKYKFKGKSIGEAFVCELIEEGKAPVKMILPISFPTYDKMRKGEWVISVKDHEHGYYTGLQVTKDPGVWFVYAGFVLMLSGCFVAFFMSHQKVSVEVTKEGGGSRVKISGTANKNKPGMKRRTERMFARLINDGSIPSGEES